MTTDWRVVTTAHDDGHAVFRSDRNLQAKESPVGAAGRIVAFAEPPQSPDDGQDNPDTIDSPSEPGSMVVDALTINPTDQMLVTPPTPEPLFEAHLVVAGSLDVTVGTRTAHVGPGGVFLPRGQGFTVRPSTTEQTRLVVLRAAPNPKLVSPADVELRSTDDRRRVQRVVAGLGSDRRPTIIHDGEPAVALIIGDAAAPNVAMVDMWQTGGPIATPDQGGDPPAPYALEPRNGGLKILDLELMAVPEGTPLSDAGWHTTATIDVDVIISGTVDMYLRDLPPVRLTAGDVLVQRGTDHLWQAIGDEPLRMSTIMIKAERRRPLV